jgi:HD superfamily phosphohydrolase
MVLYDTVYHHHKVRAGNALLQAILTRYHKKAAWPTSSRRLDSICDLLEIDEYDFYGFKYTNTELAGDIRRLRLRELPERALVVTYRGLADKRSLSKWGLYSFDFVNRADPQAQTKAAEFFARVRERTLKYARNAGAKGIRLEDIAIDIPDPPKYTRLGQDTMIQIVADEVVALADLFPFEKVVNNYSKQYKYRSYVFATEKYKEAVAYGAFRRSKTKVSSLMT